METVNIVSFMGIAYIVFGLWIGYMLVLTTECMKKYLKEDSDKIMEKLKSRGLNSSFR